MIQPFEKMYHWMRIRRRLAIVDRETNEKHVGIISGFDKFMNIVFSAKNGTFLIKGDCISKIYELQ